MSNFVRTISPRKIIPLPAYRLGKSPARTREGFVVAAIFGKKHLTEAPLKPNRASLWAISCNIHVRSKQKSDFSSGILSVFLLFSYTFRLRTQQFLFSCIGRASFMTFGRFKVWRVRHGGSRLDSSMRGISSAYSHLGTDLAIEYIYTSSLCQDQNEATGIRRAPAADQSLRE
jgi:hypothetical protein